MPGTIVLLTAFRKTRQHEQKHIDRAVRHRRHVNVTTADLAAETYERQM
jgi:hypothetical protein